MRIAAAGSFVTTTNTLRYKVLGFITVLILACALSVGFSTDKAYANTYRNLQADISKGSVTITYTSDAAAEISYWDSNGTQHEKATFGPSSHSVTISGESTSNTITVKGPGQDGTPAEIILDGVSITGQDDGFCAFALTNRAKVKLMLAEGSTNTLQSGLNRAGLEVPFGTTISIGGTGTLNAFSNDYGAGIGGGNSGHGGTINISGGTINAHSSESATGSGAGIGGGYGGTGGTINISGGTINASSSVSGGGNGAGIGGGYNSDGGTITISGGIVNARSSVSGDSLGAGIGGGMGGGKGGAGGTITISGGTIVAGGGSGASDIGEGNYNLGGTNVISGGSVRTLGNGVQPAPTNGASKAVYLNTLTLEGVITNTALTAGTIDGIACSETANPSSGVYGIKDVVSDENGILYFYLPETSQASQVSLGDGSYTYSKVYKREANNTNTATLLRAALAPVIDAQPENQTVELNAPASDVSVSASAPDTGSLSFQWYKNSSDSYVGATQIQGATQASYPLSTDTLGTTYYYCEITNTKDKGVDKTTATTYTNIVSLTVTKHRLSLTLTCADITVGQTPDPQLSGNEGKGAVSFEYKVQGADNTTYSTSVPQTAGKYTVRAKVAETDTYEAATSPEANFTIKATPKDDPTDDDPTDKDESNKNLLAETGDNDLSFLGVFGMFAAITFAIATFCLRKQKQ